jgi:hypothetical protein
MISFGTSRLIEAGGQKPGSKHGPQEECINVMLNVPMSEKLVPQISEGSHGSLLGGDAEQSLI